MNRHFETPQVVDEVGVRVDDRELGVRAATEQVASTRSCVVQKRA
jgi:hypothetical protein